jgi:hypothetical protein
MKFPDYPSNREADEMAMDHCHRTGRRQSRMKLSRETWPHKKTPGDENALLIYHLYQNVCSSSAGSSFCF